MMQKRAVFHLISMHSLNIQIYFVFCLWIINEFEKFFNLFLWVSCTQMKLKFRQKGQRKKERRGKRVSFCMLLQRQPLYNDSLF